MGPSKESLLFSKRSFCAHVISPIFPLSPSWPLSTLAWQLTGLLSIYSVKGCRWKNKMKRKNTKTIDVSHTLSPLDRSLCSGAIITAFVSHRRKPSACIQWDLLNTGCINVSSCGQNLTFILLTTQWKNGKAAISGRKKIHSRLDLRKIEETFS
jgi:hypothetical protein